MPTYFKYIITAALVVLTAEIANKNAKIGALVGALPVMTLIVVLWMFTENRADMGVGAEKIAKYVYYTFWYVLPTLPMFLVMDQMLKRGVNFWMSLGIYIVGTIALFLILNVILKKFGVNLI